MRFRQICSAVLLTIVVSSVSSATHNDKQLLDAINDQDIAIVAEWIGTGGDVNYELVGFGSLLQYAIIRQMVGVVDLLLENGVDINRVTKSNDVPPLSLSLGLNTNATFVKLTQRGANLDLADMKGQSPIFYAIKTRNLEAIRVLIDLGADPNYANSRGITPIGFAFLLQNPVTINFLIESGAAVEAEMLAEKTVCGRCHRHGKSSSPGLAENPNLMGQNENYLVKQMNDFHIGARKNIHMNPAAKILVEPIVTKLARYYAGLPRFKVPSDASKDILKAGQRVYQSQCQSCHGEDGVQTVTPLTPTVTGINSQYLSIQLLAFQSGNRDNDEGGVMRAAAANLSKEEIQAVSEYMQNMGSGSV